MDYKFWLAMLLSVAGIWLFFSARNIKYNRRSAKWLARKADMDCIEPGGMMLMYPGFAELAIVLGNYMNHTGETASGTITFVLAIEVACWTGGITCVVNGFCRGGNGVAPPEKRAKT